MIKQMRGVPGVHSDRYEDAMTIKHCALSLVGATLLIGANLLITLGEPIIYPHINKFMDELHDRHISSFMVTNAQFPDKIAELKPCTQVRQFFCIVYDWVNEASST